MFDLIQTWMHPQEKKLILDSLTEDTVMLEWGSGGSTIEFSSIVSKYYSIEHNFDWYTKINEEIKNYPLNDIDYRFVKQNIERTPGQSTYVEFKDYIDEVDKFNDKFDVVLIDGRARRLCAKKVIPYLKENSVIFIHDYVLRRPYWVVEDYFELVDASTDTEQTIAKLKLRKNFKPNAYTLELGAFDRINDGTDKEAREIYANKLRKKDEN